MRPFKEHCAMAITLPDARQLSDDVLEALRLRALRGRELGLSEEQLANLLGVARETVSRWWTAYQKGGVQALPHERSGRPTGSGRTLSNEQAVEIQVVLDEQMPNDRGIASPLWTRRAVQTLIGQLFAIQMPVRTVGEYLKRWGYTPKKPRRHARGQDPEEVLQWLENIYPAIEEFAAEEDAEILWLDEAGVDANDHVGKGYALVGETPTIEVASSPSRMNVISAFSNEGKLRFMTYAQTMTAALFLTFLVKLIAGSKRKIYLIVDRHPAHEANAVEAWLKKHAGEITLFYLPPRSPELNPVEYLNQEMKSGVNAEKLPENREELRSQMQRLLHHLAKLPEHVMSYFKNSFVQYAAGTV
jgi:transposase